MSGVCKGEFRNKFGWIQMDHYVKVGRAEHRYISGGWCRYLLVDFGGRGGWNWVDIILGE